jgi:hypothetical protein
VAAKGRCLKAHGRRGPLDDTGYAALDTILHPDAVLRLAERKTAELAFMKHYGDKPYPVMFALIGLSRGERCLVPVTCFPCKMNQARSRYRTWIADVLWRRGDPILSL